MISIVTFKYRRPGYRTVYESEHVNALAQMVALHYPHPYRFLCVTDDPAGLNGEIEHVPLWSDHLELVNPSHPTCRPNCYPRLKTFSREFGEIAGGRFVCVDLDTVIVDDLTPVWGRDEDFIIYDAKGDDHYNGSMFMMNAGAREEVWTRFDPVESPKLTTAAKMKGSDQAWIRYCLSPHAATWTYRDGVCAYLHTIPPYRDRRRGIRTHGARRMIQTHGGQPVHPRDGSLPKGARIMFFAGEFKPWDPRAWQMSPWIRDHYPLAG